jgi:hypothetical protein
MAGEDAAQRLEVELHCPECGAAMIVGIWDQSARCAYCASLLVCERLLGEEVFIVADATPGALDVIALLVRTETESLRNELVGRARNDEGLNLELPPLLDLRVAAFRAKLEASLEAVDTIDFLVPYELHERTVMQGLLGRRGAAKESFVQSFLTEDLRRLYDTKHLNLRDRGLKIRGSRLSLLADCRSASGGERFLDIPEATPNRVAPRGDRARLKIDGQAQVIAQIEGVVRERHLRLWKHMSAVRIRRDGVPEGYLVDRQFDTIAGRLAGGESSRFRALPERRIDAVVPKPSLRALASECPNCGVDLGLPPRARIAFCANCGVGIRIGSEGLAACRYSVGELPPVTGTQQRRIGFPFWSLPFRVRAGGREFTRVWDWLEMVSPQAAATRFREQDPAESRLFIPARAIFGSRELDAAFAALTATATWRQPRLRNERISSADGLRMLDVELDASEAGALARFALVALHDAQSTRSLNGLSFRKLVADAELLAGEAELAVLPLLLLDDHWIPSPPDVRPDPGLAPPGMRPVPETLLADDGALPRTSRTFSMF